MAKLAFNKLGLSKKQEFSQIQFGENTIEVTNYLEIATKSSLINAAVRGAVIDGVVDEVLLDAYLHLFIVEYYTNISFTPKQRENLLDTFDIIESNGLFDTILAAMQPGEYEYLFGMAKKLMNNLNEYNKSMVSITANAEDIIAKIVGQTK